MKDTNVNPKEINHKWKIKKRKCYSNDIKKFYKLLISQAKLKNFNIKTLGKIDHHPIFLFYPKKIIRNNKNVLIAGGFHGDESAGSWGVLEFLEGYKPQDYDKINLSFLPLVNPSGFKKAQLRNISGENPNRGYTTNKPSREGIMLIKNIKLLKKLAKDGFLTMHEDYGHKKFYIYSFERKNKPGNFSMQMLNSASNLYKKFGSGVIDDGRAEKGVVFKKHDGSFEDYLFLSGIPRCITSETPRGSGIGRRIKANRIIVEKFIELILQVR